MRRILFGSIALLGLVGTAAAEPPALYGSNYSANVLNKYNGKKLKGNERMDTSSSAAMRDTKRNPNGGVASRSADDIRDARAAAQKQRDHWELYSGR